MKEFTIEELEKILNEGNFDSLIGKIENNFFECKSQIYDLKNNHSKQELAKDVSSFANSNGGYILIGLKTRKSEIHFGDEVAEKSFLDQNLVDPNQYKDVIKDWIYPNEIQGIEIYWKASQNNSNKGIIIIKIPPQKESLKPFLISKIVEEGEKISETIFGYAERKGDRNESKKIEYIHKIIQDGLFYNENLKNRFDNLEALIQQFLRKEQKEGWGNKDRDIINKRINEILQSYENKRIIVLAAYPEEKLGKLKSLFTNEEGSIKRKLENPPLNAGRIRHAGWSLETLDIGKIIKGQFVRVQSGNTKTIDLYNDGTLIFVGTVDEEFLAWYSKDGLRINPIGLIELVYNFVSFYREVINDLTIKPNIVLVEFKFFNMHLNNRKNYLIKGPLKEYVIPSEISEKFEAPENNYEPNPIIIKTENFNEKELPAIAYQIIENIYFWFGISLDKGNIPYTKTENGKTIVDIDQIRNI